MFFCVLIISKKKGELDIEISHCLQLGDYVMSIAESDFVVLW